jgi:hypothetical protein
MIVRHFFEISEDEYPQSFMINYIVYYYKLYPRANGVVRRSERAWARGEGTDSARLFTPGERKALAKSKVHQ